MSAPVRKFKRVKVDIRVKLRRWEEPEEAAIVVRTFEIGEGGMSVYASESLVTGTYLAIEFHLIGRESPMKLRAVVRNRRGFRCGLEFLDLKVEEAYDIRRYLGTADYVVEI